MRLVSAVFGLVVLAGLPHLASAQTPTNPYRANYDWGELPNGRSWGAVSAMHPAADGNLWVAERCGAKDVGLAVIAVPLIILASGDPGLALAYPWPGAWAGESAINLAVWAGTYFLYYVSFEAFYRGFVLNTAARALGVTSALWLQAIMATLIHVGKPLPELLAAAPASLLFGVLALRSRSILYPALLHLVIGLTLDITLLARAGHLNW